jgi:nickel/cobalt transporter (NicO) family protein
MDPIHFAEQATANPWLFLAAALLLGAFHGLEPGHSKGIMTAFIIGTRGTYFQAIVLATCATLSHTAIVWILAWPASYGGALWSGLAFSPYLNLISGVIILALAYWMLRRFNRGNHAHGHSHQHDGHAHAHSHSHQREHDHEDLKETVVSNKALSVAIAMEDDEHARLHMREIASKFSDHEVSTAQVAVFGLSTGLAPCSAALVILITCFRLHQPWLGLGLVAVFSLGLGLTLTSVALFASWGSRAIGARTEGFREIARKAPFLSALVTAAIGIYLIIQFFRSY